MTISSSMKMAESSPNGWKTLLEKEKLLVSSNFSFSHSVFKKLVLLTRKNQGLFGKGLKNVECKGKKILITSICSLFQSVHDSSNNKSSPLVLIK